LYYYRARHYDPETGRFLHVDPLADDFPSWTPYHYVHNNPLRYTDPTGMSADDIIIKGSNESSVTIKTDLIDIEVDASSLVGDLGGNYELEGGDIVDAALDIGGLFDPTGAVDATAAAYHGSEGNYGSAVISGISVLPFGDVVKSLKAAKHVKTIKNAVETVKGGRKQVTKVFSTRKRALDARPKPKPAQKGGKQVTRQSRNKNGEGKKFKTDGGSQTPHVHDRNHSDKTKPNIHYRVGTKKIKP
jgi:uncharacterized protein RhaS with RHS repeats